MSKAIRTKAVLCLSCFIFFKCGDHSLERSFFDQPPETRIERLRKYPLADQYKIFRYGHDVMHPPLMDLAKPIAERGSMAVPFLLDQLNSQTDDITILGILLIFETMASSRSYAVKSDAALMTTLASKVSGMKDREWQTICLRRLQGIKDAE